MIAAFISVRSGSRVSSLSQGRWGHRPLMTQFRHQVNERCVLQQTFQQTWTPRQAFSVPKSEVKVGFLDILIQCNKALLFLAKRPAENPTPRHQDRGELYVGPV